MYKGVIMKWHKVVYPALFGVALLGSAMLLPASAAELQDSKPGSVLFFPLYDVSSGSSTQIRITDISGGNSSGDGKTTAHRVRFNFVCPEDSGGFCNSIDVEDVWTSHQTRVYDLANDLGISSGAPCEQGYLVAFIADKDGNLIPDDKLIGSAHISTAAVSGVAAYNAIAVQHNRTLPFVLPGVPPFGQPGGDVTFGSGALDTSDYVAFPTTLFSDFHAEPGSNTELILLNPNLKPTDNDEVLVQVFAWNESEKQFSSRHTFTCWERVRLTDLDSRLTASSVFNSDYGYLKVFAQTVPHPLLGAVLETNTGAGLTIRNMYHAGVFPSATFSVE
jgi:hypothetical protein